MRIKILTCGGIGLLLLSWLARLWGVPPHPELSISMSHDSAYIVQLAQNLGAGKGFVNDATFLTFLNLGRPPVPYHNANPLYACLIVLWSKISGWGAPQAGVALSITAHTLAMGLVFLLLNRLGTAEVPAAVGAALAGLFPSTWRESYAILPDMMALFWMVLTAYLLVEAVQRKGYWWWATAGAAFGLAWLTRSTALFLLPALAWYGWRKASFRLASSAVFGGAALLVCLPWLIHTQLVWGNPFRSDGVWYWLQDYYTRDTNRTPSTCGMAQRHRPH